LSEALTLLVWILAGTGAALVLGCLPGFHVYNLLAVLLLAAQALPPGQLAPDGFAALAAAAVAAWAMTGMLPMVFLSVPDESTALMMPPAQSAYRRGQGRSAALYAAGGSLGGALLIVAVLPWLPRVLPLLMAVLRPHFHWILWALILYLPLSEWPKGGTRGPAGWRRFGDGAVSWTAGLATLLLSGALGFLLMMRSPFPPMLASQSLAPALIGLFAIPSLIQSCLGQPEPLPDSPPPRGLSLKAWLAGTLTGAVGGGFAALVPAVTGGFGSLLAGQATAQSDDRAFLVAQGSSRMVYYAGALLLFAVPGSGLVRGGAAWQLQALCPPDNPSLFPLLAAAVAIGAGVSFLCQPWLASMLTRWCPPERAPLACRIALGLLLLLVAATTGWVGLAVAAVGTGIGALPLLFHSRRLNALGVVLLPIAWQLSRG
jgi:putative membrane protein